MFFTTVAPGASHVGIAVSADEFVHAPSSSGVVRVERLSVPYWSSRFVGIRRDHSRWSRAAQCRARPAGHRSP